MITLKVIYTDGSEAIHEAKSFSYKAAGDVIDARDADGEYSIYLDKGIHVVYAMNSAGNTVGKYSSSDSCGLRDYMS